MARFQLRSPRQNRSRVSFQRVLDAAAELLAERGHEGFTLLEVSRRAKVSIGSIYCRVDGKSNLLRVVDQRILSRLNADHSVLTNLARSKGETLSQVLPVFVRGLADFLERNAAILRALMALSKIDPVVGIEGKKSYNDLATKVRALLLEHRDEVRHPDPEHAVDFTFRIVHGALVRYLGIPSVVGAREGEWDRLIEDLGILCCSFLLSDWERLPGHGDRFRIESAITWNLRQHVPCPD